MTGAAAARTQWHLRRIVPVMILTIAGSAGRTHIRLRRLPRVFLRLLYRLRSYARTERLAASMAIMQVVVFGRP